MSSSSTPSPIADATGDARSPHSISISYLGLTREDQVGEGFEAHWSGWYDYFPWEDHRAGPPAAACEDADAAAAGVGEIRSLRPALQRERWQRAAITFGLDDREWNEELVLQRYELLYEAGLIPEAVRDGGRRRRRHSRPADERQIIAAFSRPGSRGCAPRSNTVPWCSN